MFIQVANPSSCCPPTPTSFLPPRLGFSGRGGRQPVVAMAKAELVERIKALQRSDPAAKQAWWDYCDNNLQGAKDPNRHEDYTLQDFLTQYESGGPAIGASRSVPPRYPSARPVFSRPPRPSGLAAEVRNMMAPIMAAPAAMHGSSMHGSGMGSPLVECVKTGQRSSHHWKNAWQAYCALYGNSINDPAKHEESFTRSFLDYMGEVTLKCLESQEGLDEESTKRPFPFAGIVAAPAAKRPRVMQAQEQGGKADLVDKIKALQRTSPELKEAWWTFCETELRGVKDPNRHSEEILQQFLAEYAP
eukprot:s3013_g6.t1